MTYFKNDKELFEFIRKYLYVASVCDILDEAGYRNQAMHQRLRPLLMDINNCGFVGRARTIYWVETQSIPEDDPYGLEIEAMDSMKEPLAAWHSPRAFSASSSASDVSGSTNFTSSTFSVDAGSLGASAPPAGPTVRHVWESFRDEILQDLVNLKR
jgi:hypothetical protein